MATRRSRTTTRFEVRSQAGDGGTRVAVSGVLDEATELDDLAACAAPVTIDLSAIERINTGGAVRLLRALKAITGIVALERCAPVVVKQLNLIPDLAERVQVRSVLVPYECLDCDEEHLQEVAIVGRRPAFPAVRCRKCKAELEPDEPPSVYLSFLPA